MAFLNFFYTYQDSLSAFKNPKGQKNLFSSFLEKSILGFSLYTELFMFLYTPYNKQITKWLF